MKEQTQRHEHQEVDDRHEICEERCRVREGDDAGVHDEHDRRMLQWKRHEQVDDDYGYGMDDNNYGFRDRCLLYSNYLTYMLLTFIFNEVM